MLKDNLWKERPVTLTTEDSLTSIKNLVENNRRLTIDQVVITIGSRSMLHIIKKKVHLSIMKNDEE